MKPNEFQCCVCKGIFKTDEEGQVELAQNYTGIPPEERGICCDSCYIKWLRLDREAKG